MENYIGYDDIIKHNNDRIKKLKETTDSNKFLKKEMALCTVGSLAFVGAIVSMNDAYAGIAIGSVLISGLSFYGAVETFCAKVDAENEIYCLKQRNEYYKNLNGSKVLKK